MDVKHKDVQHLGTFEIFKDTFKIINKNRKIFAMLALLFIHPQNYILSGFMGTLHLILRNLHEYGNIAKLFSHDWSFYWSFTAFSFIFLFGHSIFSTAAVAHTVAAVYTGLEPSANDTMGGVKKVWKRVLLTFLCVLLVHLAYHAIAGVALFLIVRTSSIKQGTTLTVFFVFYFVGLLCLVVVLQLAGVVSVLEESCGFKAMEKSRMLLKAKMASATLVVSASWLSFGIIIWLDTVVRNMIFSSATTTLMILLADILLLLLILVFLLWKLVLGTMLYFVCKSYHHESVDMSALSDQDHTPLRSSECLIVGNRPDSRGL